MVQASVAEVQRAVELQLGDGAVTCFGYSAEQEACVIGTSQGSLMTYEGEAGTVQVGTLDSAVLAIEVSPDGQLIAIMTGSGQLLLMNCFWEVEAETSVQVGFEGGQPTVSEAAAEFTLGSVAVIWRGDSRYFATVTQSSDECALPAACSENLICRVCTFSAP
jgi:elongator complex protein 1